MNEDLENKAKVILQIIEDTIKAGPWESSAFLKAIGKNLRETHDKLAQKLNGPSQEKINEDALEAAKHAPHPGLKEIYISLYAFEGNQIPIWERIIVNLPRHMISRPIYENEEDIKALIRTKENKNNEAYIALFVKESDILTLAPDKIPKDRLGKPLLTLKDKAIQLDNVTRFIHKNNVYRYRHGHLIKES